MFGDVACYAFLFICVSVNYDEHPLVSTDSGIPSDTCQVSSDTGKRLKLLRELAGISQRELAKRAGITNSSISTIEQGQVSPSVQSLVRILSAFPISLSDFFSFTLVPITTESSNVLLPRIHNQIAVLPVQYSGIFSVASAELFGVVLNGVLTLASPQGIQTVKQGQSFYVSTGQLFRVSNFANDELRLFVCSLFELPI